MTIPTVSKKDILAGYAGDFRYSLTLPELEPLRSGSRASGVTAEQSENAAWAARSAIELYGYCHLFGALSDDELWGMIPGEWLSPAVDAQREVIEQSFEATEDYLAALSHQTSTAGLDSDNEQDELEEDASDIWRLRMDAQAFWLGAIETDISSPSPDSQISEKLDSLWDLIDKWDEFLKDHPELLEEAATTPLLDNWRTLLAPLYEALSPWWLDEQPTSDSRPSRPASQFRFAPTARDQRLTAHAGMAASSDKAGSELLILTATVNGHALYVAGKVSNENKVEWEIECDEPSVLKSIEGAAVIFELPETVDGIRSGRARILETDDGEYVFSKFTLAGDSSRSPGHMSIDVANRLQELWEQSGSSPFRVHDLASP